MSQSIINGNTTLHQPAYLTIVRVALGVVLIWKGISFIRDTTALQLLIQQTGVDVFTRNAEALALVVTILTLLCGFFITVGLFTRLSAIVQIPILLVAIIFVNFKNMEHSAFDLILTVVILILLIVFAMKGSSALSADEYFRRGAAEDKNPDRPFR